MGTITLHLDNRYGIYRERFFISKSSSHLGLWNQPTTVASFSYFSRQLSRGKIQTHIFISDYFSTNFLTKLVVSTFKRL